MKPKESRRIIYDKKPKLILYKREEKGRINKTKRWLLWGKVIERKQLV